MGILRRIARRALGRSTAPTGSPEPLPPTAPSPPSGAPALARLADLFEIAAAVEATGRPKLINHWASWCDGCVDELPALAALVARYDDKIDMIGISWELFQNAGSKEDAIVAAHEAVSNAYATWENLVFDGEPDALFERLELETHTIPQTILLDADGNVSLHLVTPLDEANTTALDEAIRALL